MKNGSDSICFLNNHVMIPRMNYDLQDYLFDLQGFIVLRNAVDAQHLKELNAAFDEFPQDLPFQGWWGNVQRLDNNKHAGLELQNIVEAGEPFEKLIDHPAWVNRLHKYCGEKGSYVDGLFIDECFASVRRTGGYFPFHSGGHEGQMRNAYRYMGDGRWFCGQVNILLALTDIGPGDGGTLVIPGSHKSHLCHPEIAKPMAEQMKRGHNNIDGALEVHLKAGDALMFSDATNHGASARTNPGERRVVIYRYGPSWGNTRYGYRYSDELLARLTPARRKILQPIPVRSPEMTMSGK
jgi:ectoine hydroxylase-related dioxygenase (phytanoyl-CoA dioxygenase family)